MTKIFAVWDNLNKSQKLTAMTILGIFNIASEKKETKIKRENLINLSLKELDIKYKEYDDYINCINPEIIRNKLTDISNSEKDLLITLAYEVLFCDGMPNEKEYVLMENLFKNIAKINQDELMKGFQKIQTLLNHFT
ncbi:hypothetical protein [Flavobacterium sp.]|uniref:hypothetical protein n=1 Tax=Flavobacterium sp. TaxID=239 RepID=UPI00286D9FD8|nr:hypothetical protein [Flavobacterium sp.]